MQRQLKYGREGVVELDFPSDTKVASGPLNADPISDVAAAVTAALCEPLGYPQLRECVVPGDRVAIALDDCIPHATAVLSGVLHELSQAGVDLDNCCVVCSAGYERRIEALSKAMPDWAEPVEFTLHDPANTNQLSYLAASEDGRPIYFNRNIGDADFVVPIASIRPENAHDCFGVHSGLFPSFADLESQQRFFAREVDISPKRRQACQKDADEAAWLLGIQFTVQIIPGSGSSILHILAGQYDEVYRHGRTLSDAAWSFAPDEPAELVLAAIEGGADQQSWSHLGRALETACRLVSENGKIVLCTDLASDPGPALKMLSSGVSELDTMLNELVMTPSADSPQAAVVAVARERARIFLLSQLGSEVVEDLGIAFVASPDEINNLLRGHKSCLLLPNAHQVAVADSISTSG